jgi:hypothetical protein
MRSGAQRTPSTPRPEAQESRIAWHFLWLLVGASFGVQSRRAAGGGWVELVGNVALGLVAIVMPIVEAFTA